MTARSGEPTTERLLVESLLRHEACEGRFDRRCLLGSIAQDVSRLDVLEVNVETLAQDLDLEFEIELKFGELIQLDQ